MSIKSALIPLLLCSVTPAMAQVPETDQPEPRQKDEKAATIDPAKKHRSPPAVGTRKRPKLQDGQAQANGQARRQRPKQNDPRQTARAITPGFDFNQNFGRQEQRPTLRGQTTTPNSSSDGRFLEGIYIGFGSVDLPISAQQRVNVTTGPQLSDMSQATLLGALNYGVRDPSKEFQGRSLIQQGGNGQERYELSLSNHWGDTGAMLAISQNSRGELPALDTTATGPQANTGNERQSDAALLVLTHDVTPQIRSKAHIQWLSAETLYNDIVTTLPEQEICQTPPDTTGTPPPGTQPPPGQNPPPPNGGAPAVPPDTSNCEILPGRTLQFGDIASTEDTLRLGVTNTWSLNNWSLKSQTAYHQYENSAKYNGSQAAGAPPMQTGAEPPRPRPLQIIYENETAHEHSQSFAFTQTRRSSLMWSGGVSYYHIDHSEDVVKNHPIPLPTGEFTADETVLPNFSQDNYSVFSSASYKPLKHVSIEPSLRLNHYQTEASDSNLRYSSTQDVLLPQVNVNWRANSQWKLESKIARGHKPARFNGQFDELIGLERIVDDEYAWSFEVGAERQYQKNKLTTRISAYHIRWDNQQLSANRAANTPAPVLTVNADSSELRGIDLSASLNPSRLWRMAMTYNYTDATINTLTLSEGQYSSIYGNTEGVVINENGEVVLTGLAMPQVPRHQFNVTNNLNWRINKQWRSETRLDLNYASGTYDDIANQRETSDRKRVNLRTSFKNRRLSIGVWVNNVFDNRSGPVQTAATTATNANNGQGRIVGGTLRYQW